MPARRLSAGTIHPRVLDALLLASLAHFLMQRQRLPDRRPASQLSHPGCGPMSACHACFRFRSSAPACTPPCCLAPCLIWLHASGAPRACACGPSSAPGCCALHDAAFGLLSATPLLRPFPCVACCPALLLALLAGLAWRPNRGAKLNPVLQAVKMTLLLSLVAVPVNTAFGIQVGTPRVCLAVPRNNLRCIRGTRRWPLGWPAAAGPPLSALANPRACGAWAGPPAGRCLLASRGCTVAPRRPALHPPHNAHALLHCTLLSSTGCHVPRSQRLLGQDLCHLTVGPAILHLSRHHRCATARWPQTACRPHARTPPRAPFASLLSQMRATARLLLHSRCPPRPPRMCAPQQHAPHAACRPPRAGMMFVLLYGRKGLFAPLIAKFGFPIVFAFPGEAAVAAAQGSLGGPVAACSARECLFLVFLLRR